MIRSSVRLATVAAAAFVAGIGVSHLAQPARAASAPLQAAVYDLGALQPADLPSPNPATPNLQSKTLVAADGMTAAVQIGTIFKHTHSEANEVQVVLSGSGTEWLGEKQIPLKAGDLIVIPVGTVHGGTTDANLKIVSFKTPPQPAGDIHPVP
jgi:mannose-6-phosphate isomerase-like protein (cupin superfamily)